MYEVLLSRQAERDLDRLPKNLLNRVILDIQALATTPRPFGSQKLTGSQNDYRIRVGDYRILYEITDQVRIVRVLRVRHRREVYR